MAGVVFDYSLWSLSYPELSGSVKAALAGAYFTEATLFLDNTDRSRVTDLGQRGMLLNMLTAHIAALNAPPSLVLPSGWFKPKRVIDVYVDGDVKVRLTELLDRGSDYERVAYEMVS